MEHLSKTLNDTKKIANSFAASLRAGDVVLLDGDLGSGKTTFVQAVLESFGYKDPVRSPTFSIMNTYPVEYKKIRTIYHLDLYRIEDANELDQLGLEDIFNDQNSVVFIEWPRSEVEQFIGEEYHRIKFEYIDLNTRKITNIK